MKKIMKIITAGLLSVMVSIYFLQPLSASALSSGTSIPNYAVTDKEGDTFTYKNFASFCFVDDDLYCLKTTSDQNLLIKYSNYKNITSSNPTPTWKKVLRYSDGWTVSGYKYNSMTVRSDGTATRLYMVSGDGQVDKFNLDGVFINTYSIVDESGIIQYSYSVTTYGTQLMFSISSDKSGYRCYGVADWDGYNFVIQKKLYVKTRTKTQNNVTYNMTYQDIHYSNGKLYIPCFDGVSHNYSEICVYDISTWTDGHTFGEFYVDPWNMTGATTFEIESLATDKYGQLYMCTNEVLPGIGEDDYIYKILI